MLSKEHSKNVKRLTFSVIMGDLPSVKNMMSTESSIDIEKEKILLFSFASVGNRDGKMTKFLLNKGANPCAQAENGYTALILSTQAENPNSMKHLLKAGADISTRFKGKTALDYAKLSQNENMITLLQDWEEKIRKSPKAKTARRNSVRSYLKKNRF